MDNQTLAALLFFAALTLLLYWKRERIELQKILFPLLYFAMIKTKLGLKAMDWLARKFRKPLEYLAYLGIVVGFAGMGLITFELVRNLIKLALEPEAVSGVGVVQIPH